VLIVTVTTVTGGCLLTVVGRLGDIFGRRYFLIGDQAFGVLGGIMYVSRISCDISDAHIASRTTSTVSFSEEPSLITLLTMQWCNRAKCERPDRWQRLHGLCWRCSIDFYVRHMRIGPQQAPRLC
jgi:hypothetical protein